MNTISIEVAKEMARLGLITKQSYNNILLAIHGVPLDDMIKVAKSNAKDKPGRPAGRETGMIKTLAIEEQCLVRVLGRDIHSLRTYIYARAKSAGIKVSARLDEEEQHFIVKRIS